MARGINKVILVGNVGVDPEVRYMPNGNAVTTLSLATSETWKDKQTGDKQERTEWHRVVCFNKLGEIAGEYVRKLGSMESHRGVQHRGGRDGQRALVRASLHHFVPILPHFAEGLNCEPENGKTPKGKTGIRQKL